MKKQAPIESVVFVIDDDASVRASLKSLFESVGLQVQLFGSAGRLHAKRPAGHPLLLWCSTSGCQG